MSLVLPPSLAPPIDPAHAHAHLHLSHLASQHHHSEYNRLKFGAHGCPVRYRPLSVEQPEYYNQLRARQLQYTHPTWYSTPPASLPPPSPTVLLGPCGSQALDTVDIHSELSAAIEEPLSAPPPVIQPLALTRSASNHSVKTSSTHPINISSIIPVELLPLISSQALLRSSDAHMVPTMLDLPPCFTLDRLCRSRDRQQQNHHISAHQIPPSPPTSTDTPHTHTHFRTRSSITEALQAAIETGIANTLPSPSSSIIPPEPSSSTPQPSAGAKRKRTLTTTISDSTVSLSLSVTASKSSLNSENVVIVEPSLHRVLSLEKLQARRQHRTYPHVHSISPSSVTIGNLFLSSCPGKKVRLQGPVKGRSGVCRDLSTDLRRMTELGVKCIVCCLDDDELEFLGAPWSEYNKCAGEHGIDVLRIPIPEGLAPMDPSSVDAHLTEIINKYTLHGIPILIHCRGGVGRAGLLACCWMIKLGLCGWVEEPSSIQPLRYGRPRAQTVQFVEKAIALVRKRRSVKAVETYEQVKFLVDFVEHLCEPSAKMVA
ncbi:protein-tyrosine phosphatase-like protein [Crucibulum laeve]|uniref:Protein-tyrosine phosphatase-like protein n=1 Tax=Crucibulum laeve TaxID=68775 RepID=A0A5C3MGN8_9AGAR|nr:protein-tyrosine phosphatase-like protein [Crucibulum laeve]